MISYTTVQRTNEIGVRIAISANRQDIFVLILKQVAILTLAGILGGICCAALFVKFLSSFTYNVAAVDVATYGLAAAGTAAAILPASFIPAMRAIKLVRSRRGS